MSINILSHFRSKIKKHDRHALSKYILISTLLVLASLIWPTVICPAPILSDVIRKQLLLKLDKISSSPKFACRGEILCGSLAIPRFYERRDFRPAWIVGGDPLPQADSLINAIREADREGLRPDDYHLANIQSLLVEVRKNKVEGKLNYSEKLVDLDLLLTDAYLIYASHLLAGRVNPETIHTEWIAYNRTEDLANILNTALESNQIQESLQRLPPSHAGYERMREALFEYRIIARAGGWSTVPFGPTLRKGDRDERVGILRSRLAVSGDLDFPHTSRPYLFDDYVEDAVLKFQERHGLKADGIVGPETLAALNVPVEERIRMLEINMERWRWIPHDLGERHIVVNLARFELNVIEDNQQIISMLVVVGRPARSTPVFSAQLQYLVFNPYWHIPTKIAVEDILPKVLKDPDYLIKQKIKVFQGWGGKAPEIEPKTVRWSLLNSDNFPYKLRQETGPQNALGRIKFMFPNKFSVYLHDTPARGLFKRTKRDFSAGCIRIAKPIELAEYLLKDNLEWPRYKIRETISNGERKIVRLSNPIPVHILYLTSWVGIDGKVYFFSDVYDRDKAMMRALEERPPKA